VLTEAKVNRWLRTMEMISRSTITISTQYTTLPADFREAKTLKLIVNGADVPFEYLNPSQMIARNAKTGAGTGQPSAYTIVGLTLEVNPTPDASYTGGELAYFQKVPSLSVSNTTNWLLTKHPDVYLYGALLHAAPYLKADERVPVWQSFYDAAQDEIRIENERAAHSGAPLKMRTPRSIG
jgi:hypothetical protein